MDAAREFPLGDASAVEANDDASAVETNEHAAATQDALLGASASAAAGDELAANRAAALTAARIERSMFPKGARGVSSHAGEEANVGKDAASAGTRDAGRDRHVATRARGAAEDRAAVEITGADTAFGAEPSPSQADTRSRGASDERASSDDRSGGDERKAMGTAQNAAASRVDGAESHAREIELAAGMDKAERVASSSAPRPSGDSSRLVASAPRATAAAATDLRAARGGEVMRQLDEMMRARRQDAAASAVNHMTLRNGVEGSVELAGLGRVHVAAHTQAGEVDVELRAQPGDGAAVLYGASAALEAELRNSGVNLRNLSVSEEREGEERREGSDEKHRDPRGERGGYDETEPREQRRERAFEQDEPSNGEPVRFVL